MRAWAWIKKYWYVPLTVLVAILGAVGGVLFQRRLNNPVDRVKDELKAIDVAAETSKAVQKEGIEAATKQLEKTHADTIATMDKAALEKKERLRSNPSALSKHLVRAAERSRRERARSHRDPEG